MIEIVAEISGNHGGSIHNALRLIRAAADAGADAVKFQCFDPERLAARRAKNPEVQRLAGGVPLVELYRQTHTPREWFPRMSGTAMVLGLKWFSSVFDPDDVRFLELFECPRYKISAFEMLDWDIIKAVKETGKPIVMSVRPMQGLTVLYASGYDGQFTTLGMSSHGKQLPWTNAPMVEYHLRLEDVETPDSAFSLTAAELRANILSIRQMA
jgi:sialic acid synthase SpsE